MMEKTYLTELTRAEQAATDIIRKAQEQRDRRLKEAKFDAEQELGKFRADLDAEYSIAAEQDAKGIDPELQALQEKYRLQTAEVVEAFNKSKNEAVEFLVEHAFQVNLEVPKVVIGKFD